MPGIAVEVVINAPTEFVWDDVKDIASHVTWMQDAAEIRFISEQSSGLGTRFECDTVVGPIKLTDIMEITEWQTAAVMGVRHQGIVGGVGRFDLRTSGSTTIFSWVETLTFPWYLGGPVGAVVSKPVLRAIWRGNLRRLKSRIEAKWLAQEQSD